MNHTVREQLVSADYFTFNGAGIRGYMFMGALEMIMHLRGNGDSFDHVKGAGGTSSGAFVALLVVLGISSEKCRVLEVPLQKILHSQSLDVGRLPKYFGLSNDDKIVSLIKQALELGGLSANATLRDLQRLTRKQFVCISTNIKTHKSVCLSAADFPDLKVTKALSMSMALPLVFSPVIMDGDLYVDGGVSLNLPFPFPSNQTVAFRILPSQDVQINTLLDYATAVINTMVYCSEESTLRLLEHPPLAMIELNDAPGTRNNMLSTLNTSQTTHNTDRLWKTGAACVFRTIDQCAFLSTAMSVMLQVVHYCDRLASNSNAVANL